MSLDASSWAMAHPNFFEPEILMQYNQRSDYIELLAGRAPRVKLGQEDKYVYLRHLGVKTKVSSGQAGANQVPSCSITADLASAPVYLQQVRAEYDHHQINMADKWGFSLPLAQSLAMQQGHYQQLRDKALFGMFPANGEGFLNATGATYTTLPQDSLGNQRFSTYDNGQMALFLLSVFSALKSRTYQMGMAQRFVIIGPQQDIGIWQYQGVVQLTSFQRAGAGSETITGTVEEILKRNGDEIVFGYDDTLIGAGAGGTDAIIFAMPEVKRPAGVSGHAWNTNKFAELQPGFNACTLQYSDVIAPIEITAPLPAGATDVYSEMSATSGWAPRPEALLVLSGAN
jgi:hypothetical protein